MNDLSTGVTTPTKLCSARRSTTMKTKITKCILPGVIFTGLSLICLNWRGGFNTSPKQTSPSRQTTDEVLKAAASISHIKEEELSSVIMAAKKGDLNSVNRLRTHYFLVGPPEKYQEWLNFGEDLSKPHTKDLTDDLPQTQKMLEALKKGLNE
jgi:hypothetical protein